MFWEQTAFECLNKYLFHNHYILIYDNYKDLVEKSKPLRYIYASALNHFAFMSAQVLLGTGR